MPPRSFWLKGFTGLVYLYLYAPIAILTLYSFNSARLGSAWKGFTLQWYLAAYHNAAVMGALRRSLYVALITTAVATVIGTLAALATDRYRFRLRAAFEGLAFLPIVVPEIVIAVSLVVFFGLLGVTLGMATVVVAHVAFSVSYVVFVVRARLAEFDRTLEEAAMDLGADQLTTFFRVTLPLLMPGILAAALLVFTLSIDDFVITSFVAGVGATTLPLQIYSMIKTTVTPEINAVSTVLLAVTILLAILSQRAQSGKAGRGTAAVAFGTVGLLGAAAFSGSAGAPERVLNLYTWSGYVSPRLAQEFERRTGVHIQVDLFDNNEALLAKLQSGVVSYDLVVPSDYMVGILTRQELLLPLDHARLPRLGNLSERFLDPPYDPGNRYTVPYVWGTSGIGYRKDKVLEPVDSWDDLWDPRYRDRIGMLDDMRENFTAALAKLGLDPNSTNRREIAAARNLLLQQKPLVKTYNSSNFEELLLSGDVWLHQSFNGQVAKAAQEDPRIGYVIPREGTTIWVDNMAIPVSAADPDLAYLFIDYVLEPRTAAEILNSTLYSTPNRAARPHVRPELLRNPAIFPPEELLAKCSFATDLGPAITLYDRYWTEIKSR
jgi:spermidine/putrescine transport system permease protein